MDERAFQTFDLVDHPVFVLAPDADGIPRYVAYNDFACKTLARERESFLGRTARECFPGEFGEVTYDHHVAALETGEERVYEVLLPMDDGAELIRTVLRPVRSAAGEVTHLVGSSTLLAGRSILRQVSPAQDHGADADAEAFVSLAAHELRSPLRSIGMIFEMLCDEFEAPSDDAKNLFGHFERLHQALFDNIDDILAHSNAMETAEDCVDFDLETLVNDVLLVRDPMGLCKVTLTPARLIGDRRGIQIVLGNLIDNAIKHAQPAGGVLALDISVAPDRRGFVSISLSDNGLGFKEPALALLDGGQLRPGSGFGLFGIRRLIHSRGGRLVVTRAGGHGGARIAFSLRGKVLSDDFRQPGAVGNAG